MATLCREEENDGQDEVYKEKEMRGELLTGESRRRGPFSKDFEESGSDEDESVETRLIVEGDVSKPVSKDTTMEMVLRRLEVLEKENIKLRAEKMMAIERKNEVKLVNQPFSNGGVELVTLLQASQTKIPMLSSLDQNAIYEFIVQYNQYKMICPASFLMKPQQCVVASDMETLSDVHVLTRRELMATDPEEFIDYLCSVHAAASPLEARNMLKRVKMKNDDLSMAVLKEFNDLFKFQIKCIGDRYPLREREMA